MIYKTYKGERLDLEFYQGKSTIDYEIEVLNDDGSDFDFTVFDSIDLSVKYRQHGEEIISEEVDTQDNYILLSITKEQSESLQTREYWYEIYATDGVEEELVVYGLFKVV